MNYKSKIPIILKENLTTTEVDGTYTSEIEVKKIPNNYDSQNAKYIGNILLPFLIVLGAKYLFKKYFKK